ncbi:MAG: substrate-binding domain-containing protein, partial [Qingshengfaniella sp.]
MILQQSAAHAPSYLTTKEVADLLRVKERKVYDLAAAGEIPHRRITGKLLFPSAEITAWIEGEDDHSTAERPPVLTGSHDPLLDWAVRESGSGLATLLNGSLGGLDSFRAGQAALAGMHIPEKDGGWNLRSIAARGLKNTVLIAWARRSRGLIVAPAARHTIHRVSDLRGKRVVLRQPGAGAAALMDQLLAAEDMTRSDLVLTDELAHTESDAAAAVAAGAADAVIGIEGMARRFNLDFVPLVEEQFDLLIDRRAYFTDPVQALLDFARIAPLAEKAKAMGGYDLS